MSKQLNAGKHSRTTGKVARPNNRVPVNGGLVIVKVPNPHNPGKRPAVRR